MAEIVKPNMTNLWASGGAVVAPPASKVDLGWTAEIPPHQYQNWYQLRADSAIAYMFQRGIPEWDSTTEYFVNKSFAVFGGVVYKAIANSVNQNPSTATSYWEPLLVPASSTRAGVVELATTSEIVAGTSAALAISPLGLAQALPQMMPLRLTTVTATGNFVVPAGVYFLDVKGWAGGGGGGGVGSTGGVGGGGGGGGEYFHWRGAVTPGQTISCTVGAGGSGGGAGAGGGPGGNTAFGTIATAVAGTGGASNGTGNGGTGGTGGTGTAQLRASGGDGNAASTAGGGPGGAGSFGGAGGGGGVGVSGPGVRPGGGGGGRGPANTGSGANGGAGLIVIEY